MAPVFSIMPLYNIFYSIVYLFLSIPLFFLTIILKSGIDKSDGRVHDTSVSKPYVLFCCCCCFDKGDI